MREARHPSARASAEPSRRRRRRPAAASGSRKWLILPGVVLSFLFQHAVQGWCPPVPVFRRLGVRTRDEIDREKYALKALRGDFRDVGQAGEALEAVRR